MADAIFKLRAARLDASHLPRAFQTAQRGATAAAPLEDDPFLPRGLLRVDQAFDLSATARSLRVPPILSFCRRTLTEPCPLLTRKSP